MIGDIVDKYQIVKKLGEGGMATVYQARHTSLPRDVAIKILHPVLASNQRNRERFEREAKAIEQLDHPNIVQILDYSGQNGSSCYIITELIEGLTLRQLMEEQKDIPSEVIALIGMKICNALEYAHSLGLIHRDIKLENVMIRQDGAVKLMDFGIVRFSEESQLTLTGTLVGSPAYMSPEQALEAPIDHRSDLFSLGTLLFHLATRELPFHGSNPSVILKNIIDNQRNQPHHINPQISITLNEIIDNLLQTSPDKRYQSASEIYDALQDVFVEDEIDLSDYTWSVKFWLADPCSYQVRLEEHLVPTLLEKGRNLLNAGKHLEAQLYFNRLLSIDPNNEPVFDLLQEMHTYLDQASTPKKGAKWWPFLLSISVSLLLFFAFQKTSNSTKDKQLIAVSESEQEIEPIPLESTSEQPQKEQGSALTNRQETEAKKTTVLTEKPTLIKKPIAALQKIKQKIKPNNLKIAQVTEAKINSPDPVQKGKLTVSIPNAWADIWIDDQKVGRTGQVDPIAIIPGEHTLRLENQYSLPHKENFTIESGEDKHIRIASLKRKPALVVFSSQHEKDCTILLDKKDVGSLQDLSYRLSIIEPNLPHQISMKCNEELSLAEISQLSPGSTVPVRFD